MSARPYDMAAYSPATSSAEISVESVSRRLRPRDRQHWIAGLLGVGKHDCSFPVRQVLRHYVRRIDLPVCFETNVASREHRVANVDVAQRFDDFPFVYGTGLDHRDVQRPCRFVSESCIPLGVELRVRFGPLL